MKIKYILNKDNIIIAIKYIVVNEDKSRTGYDLVAEGVELPVVKNYQEIEINDIEKVHLGYSQVINGMFYENAWSYDQHLNQVKQSIQEKEKVGTIKQELSSIKKWLNDNDYIINKHTLGEYTDTDTRWTNYLAERKVKLQRYNELEVILNETDTH